jgi:hypothetical protein
MIVGRLPSFRRQVAGPQIRRLDMNIRLPPGALLPPNHFRPLSVLSLNASTHSSMKEDDAMISVSATSNIIPFTY